MKTSKVKLHTGSVNSRTRSRNGKTFFLPILILVMFTTSLSAQNWIELFNGKNLNNWEKKNGNAEYQIKENEIVGISRLNTPNTFLCTKETYSDFILRLDVKVDVGLNSGIQIRSLSTPDYRDSRVHGYQVEIDPAERAWSGGIYDEARRGWLYPLSRNEKGRRAFKNGQWNHYRIEAVGNSLRTWINGIQCANLADDMTTEGFIALQVHGVQDKKHEGLTVRWKNIEILTEDIEKYRMETDPDVPEVSWLVNKLTETEKRKGWRLLWDGETTKGWRGANADKFSEFGWEIKNGNLSVIESGGAKSRNGGDIVTEKEFSSFELELDFMITEGANSGIKYFVVEGIQKRQGSAIGLEYQILDDKRHPDAKKGVNDNRTVASLYDLIKAENLSEPDRNSKRFNEGGQWNKTRLVVKGKHVEHWLNNVKVVEYERGSQIYRNLVANSKYAKYPNFGEAPKGHILLQDHGNRVSFRSIKILEL